MNDEIREENSDVTDAMADAAADMVSMLQDEVDELQEALATSKACIAELEATPVVAAAPAGDDELRGFAATYRAAVRNGHPDAPKHLEILLSALGA